MQNLKFKICLKCGKPFSGEGQVCQQCFTNFLSDPHSSLNEYVFLKVAQTINNDIIGSNTCCYHVVCQHIKRIFNLDHVSVFLIGGDGNMLKGRGSSNIHSNGSVYSLQIPLALPVPKNSLQYYMQKSFTEQSVYTINDRLTQDASLRDYMCRFHLESIGRHFIIAPIRHSNKSVGILCLFMCHSIIPKTIVQSLPPFLEYISQLYFKKEVYSVVTAPEIVDVPFKEKVRFLEKVQEIVPKYMHINIEIGTMKTHDDISSPVYLSSFNSKKIDFNVYPLEKIIDNVLKVYNDVCNQLREEMLSYKAMEAIETGGRREKFY